MSNQGLERQEATTSEAETLLLLVEGTRNRELLAEQLGGRFEIQTLDDDPLVDPSFDLCLLDPSSQRRLENRLREIQSAAAPTFLPFLLLADRETGDHVSRETWTLVDEIVTRPVSKAELDVRIDNLLQRRRLSLELTREKEHSTKRFESLFQSTPDPAVVVTEDGTVTEVNEAFERLFEHTPELVGRQITELQFTPIESVERVLVQAAWGDRSTTINVDTEGEAPRVTELSTAVVSGESHRNERIGIFRDVTEREERERDLERQNERLEEFADTIAHDLRNPLNVAKGRLEVARKTGDDKQFDIVGQSHERMEQMIDELLSLAKQGQAVLEPDPVALDAIAEQAWKHVETPRVALEIDVDDGYVIEADRGRACQLLENLFRNTVDHGSDAATVRVGTLPQGTGFYVEDDGPGVPKADRNKIFEAGYSDVDSGTGFGLSIVRQIVDGHDWSIDVTDGTLGGARFEIYTRVQE